MVKNGKPKAISLFSGAMGFDLGLEKAGFDISVAVEYDKMACQTIRANSKIPVIENDINNVSSDEILDKAHLKKGDVFLVAGVLPCQAFSTAGKRKSLEDFRGNVIISFLRVVEDLEPEYFILENVRGILSATLNFVPEIYEDKYDEIVSTPGSVIYFLHQEFEKLGYYISFSLFNSANYGVPQIRERVLMFGSKKKRIPLPSPTHSQTGNETGLKWTTIGEAFTGLKVCDYVKLPERLSKFMVHLQEGENWKDLPEFLQKDAMGKSLDLVGGKTGFYRRLSFDYPSPTLVTSPTMPATLLCHPTELRPLSIQEYSRIQQFPDTWKFQGKILDIYKQIGNAVPVGLGFMAGKTVLDFDRGEFDSNRERTNQVPYSRYRECSDFEFISNFKTQINLKKSVLTLF